MYKFCSYSSGWLITTYSPKEIARFACFDAVNEESNDVLVIDSKDVDFKSFEFIKL
ncbi:MAG: hypothetical protein ABSH12_06150 [Endomicrobiales bacterium]|jgi:hypothetical protein